MPKNDKGDELPKWVPNDENAWPEQPMTEDDVALANGERHWLVPEYCRVTHRMYPVQMNGAASSSTTAVPQQLPWSEQSSPTCMMPPASYINWWHKMGVPIYAAPASEWVPPAAEWDAKCGPEWDSECPSYGPREEGWGTEPEWPSAEQQEERWQTQDRVPSVPLSPDAYEKWDAIKPRRENVVDGKRVKRARGGANARSHDGYYKVKKGS